MYETILSLARLSTDSVSFVCMHARVSDRDRWCVCVRAHVCVCACVRALVYAAFLRAHFPLSLFC